ncbi:MAG: hypothetical protein JXB05_38875 [Myxococcaceae bacterium]|nr:hypothetical protein [Myxococcaceae bacterium]
MTDFLSQIRNQGQQNPAQAARGQANQRLGGIPALARQALREAARDWIALECLANGRDYAKPDTQKRFVLWEARKTGLIHIELGENVQAEHAWVLRLFLPINTFVRFPFNSGDSSQTDSLSWHSIDQSLLKPDGQLYELPRWSTASRSSVALVPQNIAQLPKLQAWPGEEPRQEVQYQNHDIKVHMREWADLDTARANPLNLWRFYQAVGDVGAAASSDGIMLPNGYRARLYSIKTGVHYVGSKYQGPPVANKHRLEANSAMAMLRSNVVRALPNGDDSFGLQPEILTITAPLRDGSRDGFQVRDLSCLRRQTRYLPGQAIPYARWAFDAQAGADGQCDFWRANFAVPLGRAKARLFLNYGLIHTSANAQNFVLGFPLMGRPGLMQFVVRDLGDTSWHDDFIRDYLSHFGHGQRVWRAFRSEASAAIRHVLHDTSSGQYPAPEIVRLAAFSLLTHGFGENLGWNRTLQHRFLTGLFDGFLSYVRQTLNLAAASYPGVLPAAPLTDPAILTLGEDGAYPHPTPSHARYCERIEACLGLTAAELFGRAAYVRSRAQHVITSDNTLRQAINAEELLLCAGIERLLRTMDDGVRSAIRDRLETAFAGHWPAVVEL